MNTRERAQRHALRLERPAPHFFEGALLGNGGLGAVVTTRPDAVLIHFGHNNVWDIRIKEDHQDEIGTFEELFDRLKKIPPHYASLSEDEWYRDYVAMTSENYSFPYPRPMPCGSLLLGFDRRVTELLGHTLHIDSGVCEVHLLSDGVPVTLRIFVDQEADRLWATVAADPGRSAAADRPAAARSGGGPAPSRAAGPGGAAGSAGRAAALFNRVRLLPDPGTPKDIPAYETFADAAGGRLAFRQTLPFTAPAPDGGEPPGRHPRDRAFRLSAQLPAAAPCEAGARELELGLGAAGAELLLCVQLEEGLDREVPGAAAPALPRSGAAGTGGPPSGVAAPDGFSGGGVSRAAFDAALAAAEAGWDAYWARSGVALEDELLEQVWYRNLYFFHCAVKPEAVCPGLFANWSCGSIGAEWHGDYHMNYNTQQPFWLAFSSNHADKHLAYVNMVDHVLPVSRKWAKDYYGLRGAYYPHSAYPVEMSMMPYPVPHWGWEICETPWTVQSLWWHYLYTMDRTFLKDRAFTPIREAVLFMVDYMKRPDASGEAWGDDRYHIYPTVVPELYELTPGFRRNSDCLVDLTLTKFLFRAFREACEALDVTAEEAELLAEVEEVLAHFPAYPTAESRRGTVFVSVPDEDPEVIYNVPNGITTVFPGEEHGLHSDPETYAIAVNSYRNHRNEGGNELVFYHMAGARLGQLDLERFKRQIVYCMLPNGTCTDRVLETGGRYADTTSFDFMSHMGVWFENFALPAVINECLLQSYNGILRLFPNWPADRRAAFSTLRAVGGFLVSAQTAAGVVERLEIYSEAGSELRLYNPWGEAAVIASAAGSQTTLTGSVLTLGTAPGETIRLARAAV